MPVGLMIKLFSTLMFYMYPSYAVRKDLVGHETIVIVSWRFFFNLIRSATV